MTNQEAISVLESIDAKTDYFLINDDARAEAIDMAISALQAQELSETQKPLDTISRQAVRYKLAALVNEFEEILSHIREREVNDSVCGLCEYDGAYIGQSGDWCNECPGFEKDDCFKLKEEYRKEWTDING
jgi:hypothetical protein